MHYKTLIILLTLGAILSIFYRCTPANARDENTEPLTQLVRRTVPSLEKKVHFIVDTASVFNANEACNLRTENGELFITANSTIAAASGFNLYLKYYCHNSISHTGNNLQVPEKLPAIEDSFSIKSNYLFRYALNYCTINYTMSFWDWPRWEKELDWMAMNGVNVILAPLGNELVWYNTLQKMGFSDSLALSYAPGPAFTAWWLMGNLEGWQGPLSKSFVEKQSKLQQKILSRCKELGITPVVQGFYGMVPTFLKSRFPAAHIIDQGNWEGGFSRSAFLDPSDTLFKRMAGIYYNEMLSLYGSDLKFFGGDPFHEGGKTGGLDLGRSGKAIYDAVASHYPGSIWVLQAWQGNPHENLLDGFGKGHTLVLDLFGESDNNWEKRNGYSGHPWLWCMINNFGEKTGMTGKLHKAVVEPLRAAESEAGKSMKGIGIIPEGIENNNVLYDLLLEMAWHQQPVVLTKWIKQYSAYRYGEANDDLEKAWILLLRSVYSSPPDYNILGPTESVMLAKPSLDVKSVSTWGTTKLFYDTTLVKQAALHMIAVAPQMWHVETFSHDCVDLCRQVLSDRSTTIYNALMDSYHKKRKTDFKKYRNAFLQLILQQDSLCSMNKDFTLARWLDQARTLGSDANEKKMFEKNAKVQISYWGPINPKSSLIDYASKQWSGMLRTYYYDRWKLFLDSLDKRVDKNRFPLQEPAIDYFIMEKKWTEMDIPYSTQSLVADRDAFLKRIIH
ncbi:alpha-N-acetylglucosaminidase [Pinibacter aurantiacus]|uniref:Alpha-N-acetylglucosaminidase n=1 Tax=Pinibacter aurantiacus TaxID=2851599 RepID=A0A9E2W5E7_9BACT|nr:alpha-N-acetylglucosaminidase [Pinibacter aurantiacus]MBV4358819.1 alpha-N-acetylglucosaminidase [Pinibacter aurantiacus]